MLAPPMHRRALSSLLLLAALPLAAAEADVVILDNRQRITGSLEDDPASSAHVLIRDDQGTLRIRRARVVGVELGLASRLARVRDQDLAGLLDLARWCRAKGHRREALQCLDKARRLPGFPIEAAGQYALLVDELDGPETALPLYVWYRGNGGRDNAVLTRIRMLSEAGADLGGAGTAPALAAERPAPAAPATAKPIGDGLEVRGWGAENPQYANPAELKLVTGEAAAALEGARQALEVTSPGGQRDKTAIKRTVSYSVAPNAAVLSFRCANLGQTPIRVAVAVKTGAWVFHESEGRLLAPGASEALRFDLRTATFKSEATGWSHSGRVQGLEEVKELQVLIYNKDRPARVLIADMAFVGDQEM